MPLQTSSRASFWILIHSSARCGRPEIPIISVHGGREAFSLSKFEEGRDFAGKFSGVSHSLFKTAARLNLFRPRHSHPISFRWIFLSVPGFLLKFQRNKKKFLKGER